ncbi:MAG: GNAT family N-acetyltransferase [Acidobacteriota bacterium]|nr:GNAT family N-acetyltransferase [Acidobacteriota bacterium]
METLKHYLDPGPLADRDFYIRCTDYSPHLVHKVPCYHFALLHTETGAELGWLRLRIGSTPHIERYAGHVGYQVEPAHRGHHYAARALRLIVRFAGKLGINPLWITCDPENLASRRTLELASAEFVEIVDVPPNCIIFQTGHPKKCRYRL